MTRQSTRDIIGFNDTWFIVVGNILTGLIFPLMVPSLMPKGDPSDYLFRATIATGFSTLFWLLGRIVLIFIRKKYPEPTHFLKRIVLQTFWMVLIIIFVSGICEDIIFGLIRRIYHGEIANVPFLPILLGSIVFSFGILAMYDTIYAISNWKKAVIEAERLRKENLQSQLDSLRSQVNPHFLFNSLNTLTSLVHDQPDLSVQFIQHLSATYRHVLEFRDQTLISLADELKCIESYLFLLQIRFEAGLKVEMNIDEEAKKKYIVPLALQILIENAIKHNIASQNRPLRVEITLTPNQELMVKNNLQRKNLDIPSTQTGLDNIRSRYLLISGKNIEVIEQHGYFSVTLPLITLEKYADSDHRG